MALDFPANPTNGQVYDSYVYNSTVGAWQSREDSRTVAILSSTAPTSANPGDIWVNTNDGISFVYYDDGTSAQWMELLPSGVPLLDTKADLTYVDSQDALKANIASPTFTGVVTAPRFTSTQATGTAPFTVSSTTVVSNLNADFLDGIHASSFAQLTGASFTGAVSIAAGGGSLKLKANASADHTYLEFYPRTASPSTRGAYLGYPSNGSNNLTIANEIASSQIILSSAYVKMPNQPSFCARGVSNPTGTRSFYLFDQTIDFNVGSNYNSSTGRFTAPTSGIYFFEFHLFGAPNTRYLATINKNGVGFQEYTQEQPNGAGTAQGYGSIDGKIVMSLAASDYVTVSGSATVLGTTNIYSSFSGYLIG